MHGLTTRVVDQRRSRKIDEEAYKVLYPEHSAVEPSREQLHMHWRNEWQEARSRRIVIQRPNMQEGLYDIKNRKPRCDAWQAAETAILVSMYPDSRFESIQQALVAAGYRKRSAGAIEQQAHKCGLRRRMA